MVTSPTGAPAATHRPRCPRCGAAMGLLASAEYQAPEAAATEYYCGCCGLVIAPTAPAAR